MVLRLSRRTGRRRLELALVLTERVKIMSSESWSYTALGLLLDRIASSEEGHPSRAQELLLFKMHADNLPIGLQTSLATVSEDNPFSLDD